MEFEEFVKPGAVVVLSGGQDSTICLFWAKQVFGTVVAVSFDYGQRHKIELESAQMVAHIAGVKHAIIDAAFISRLAPSALTREEIAIACPAGKLPTTFVDGRNLFFLSMAAVYTKQLGFCDLVTGVCQTDFSGYPDCRRDFVDSLEETLGLAMDYRFQIHTPMMFMTKAREVAIALDLGPGCWEALAHSHTCYAGQFPPCGACPACLLRAKGFSKAGIEDPLLAFAQDPAGWPFAWWDKSK